MESAGLRLDVTNVFGGKLCLVNWFDLWALGLILLILTDNHEILSSNLVQVLFNQVRSPFFHQVRIVQYLLNRSLVHSLGNTWHKTDTLSLFHKIKLHLVDMLDLFDDPSLWLLSLERFNSMQNMSNNSFNIVETFISQAETNLKFWVAVKMIVASSW